MCGIFGYIGDESAVEATLKGLKRLEYRGYDSAGLATIIDGKLMCKKCVGPVAALEKELPQKWRSKVAISHTRWATHGRPTLLNAHPHLDSTGRLAIVHNGIIENSSHLRRELQAKGVRFQSDTDTEVIAELISLFYENDLRNDLRRAVACALDQLEGSYAITVLHEDHPHALISAANFSPLCLGLGTGEMFIASDPAAFSSYTQRIITLSACEIALVTPTSFEIFDKAGSPLDKTWIDIGSQPTFSFSQESFPHFTLKEIFEQPKTIEAVLEGRVDEAGGTAFFEELKLSDKELAAIERIIIIACGSSYHAGLVGAMMLREKARIVTEVEIASEFRFCNPIIDPKTLVIAISQSGETADLLAALSEARAKGAQVVALCNVATSTLARQVSSTLLLRAGFEVAVASTKTFTNQLVLLLLFALKMARLRQMSSVEGKQLIDYLKMLPAQVNEILGQADQIAKLATRFAHLPNFFYIGCRYQYFVALEGSLKIKEIAYVPSQAYPAGEIKHGPIALIDENCLTLAFAMDRLSASKMMNSLSEIRARLGLIVAVAMRDDFAIAELADEVIWLPQTSDEVAAVLTAVVAQLIAYFVADERKAPIDRPRNLAKSVTV